MRSITLYKKFCKLIMITPVKKLMCRHLIIILQITKGNTLTNAQFTCKGMKVLCH